MFHENQEPARDSCQIVKRMNYFEVMPLSLKNLQRRTRRVKTYQNRLTLVKSGKYMRVKF